MITTANNYLRHLSFSIYILYIKYIVLCNTVVKRIEVRSLRANELRTESEFSEFFEHFVKQHVTWNIIPPPPNFNSLFLDGYKFSANDLRFKFLTLGIFVKYNNIIRTYIYIYIV